MPMSLEAANPHSNAIVAASAGSGKTWMLVTRILRLLLEGAEPGGIMALTFTRKAAGEMQQRLAERLYELATLDDTALDKALTELGLQPTDHYRQTARSLYEYHQYCHYPVRTQTFHSFCQDILARFPLEADVPPGFQLLESSTLLIQQARDALFNEAAVDMNSPLAQNLEALLSACGSLFSLEKALNSFLHQRSDWWAFTENNNNNCDYATDVLKQQLDVDLDSNPIEVFFKPRNLEMLRQFSALLAQHDTKTNLKFADTIAMSLAQETYNQQTFNTLYDCFYTGTGTPRVRKDSPTLRKKLGDDGTDQLLELNTLLTARIHDALDQYNRQKTFELNRLWYQCGETYINHYQTLKRQQRLLDFTDLEWRTYKLLQGSENALWVQYKLDQRIDHLLIDEFQDTNPTQWQLILPLLEEMASSELEKPRSIFIVGDEKQSIYSFRRAKPELLGRAADWLEQHLAASRFPMNKSWRSSPAIINAVNEIFSQDIFKTSLPGFHHHETNREALAGKVTLLPLTRPESDQVDNIETPFRNPLQQPRYEQSGIYLQEGQQIAQVIQQLMNDNIIVGEGEEAHCINYDDIFILVRKRTHVADYETALRQAGIPYLGANKGTFLDCLEIQDMEALLDTLLTPFNNLSLAQVLKSPLFSAHDEHLMLIAKHGGSHLWIDRLANMQSELPPDHPLNRAYRYIQRWRTLTDKIPVHDLLDRIYSEANVLERYKSSTPESLKPRVHANLVRFMELALELDSGRYPSLMHFLQYLRSLKQLVTDAPDEAPVEVAESRVKIMTIHASKGLEAPVVFLADTITSDKDRSALETLVDWPVEQAQPRVFQLIPGKDTKNEKSSQLVQQQQQHQQQENANLLYVALTRAKQLLYVSACQPANSQSSQHWYHNIQSALKNIATELDDGSLEYAYQQLPIAPQRDVQDIQAKTTIDPALTRKPDTVSNIDKIIAPSKTVTYHDASSGDEDGQLRGIAIHRCLDLLTRSPAFNTDSIRQHLATELKLDRHDTLIEQAITESQQLLDKPELHSIFYPDDNTKVYNELPIHYLVDDQMVYGIIDRLLVNDNEVTIIDYKSHQQVNSENIQQIANTYTQQMQLYAQGIRRVWPNKSIHACLLFTHCSELHTLDIN